jgi:hypothetical protein
MFQTAIVTMGANPAVVVQEILTRQLGDDDLTAPRSGIVMRPRLTVRPAALSLTWGGTEERAASHWREHLL